MSFQNSFLSATTHEAIIGLEISFFFSGGKDGPVGFADFVYKHIVPACFLAPLKQTFDLADAQTVLVCIMNGFFFAFIPVGQLQANKLKIAMEY